MGLIGMLAVGVAVAAYAPYLWAILSGRGRPNRASWWIFAATGLFAAASAWAGGAREGLWVPLTYGLLSTVVALVAIRRGEGGWTPLDRGCLAIAAGSLLVWWISGDPLLCVAMNAAADTAGHVPTVVKAWREPRREPVAMWCCVLTANLLNLAQIGHWSAIEALYPLSLAWNALAVIVGWCAGRIRERRLMA